MFSPPSFNPPKCRSKSQTLRSARKKAEQGEEIERWGTHRFWWGGVKKGFSVAGWLFSGDVSTEERWGEWSDRGPEREGVPKREGVPLPQQPEWDARERAASPGQNMPGFAGCCKAHGERASCRQVA